MKHSSHDVPAELYTKRYADSALHTPYPHTIARRPILAVVLLLFVSCARLSVTCAWSEQTPNPAIIGYVTRVASPTDFYVNGTHILCDSGTQFICTTHDAVKSDVKKTRQASPADRALFIGEPIEIDGVADKKTHTIVATEVAVRSSPPQSLGGTAIIDHILTPDDAAKASAGDRLLRADGYRILVTRKTETRFTPPLTSLAGVGTNVWLTYRGTLRPDGVLEADTAAFTGEHHPQGRRPSAQQSRVRPQGRRSGYQTERPKKVLPQH